MTEPVGHAEAVARRLHPHLWNGKFESTLAKLSIFTPEQAAESVAKKRAEKIAVIQRVLDTSRELQS